MNASGACAGPVARGPAQAATIINRGAARIPLFNTSDGDRARADEVRQLGALLLVEERVDLAERADHRVAQLGRALHAQLGCLLRLGVVERGAADGVGEPRDRAPPIDVGLRAL